jgi:SPP1 gp7 family putative phage head morphogenesis protein
MTTVELEPVAVPQDDIDAIEARIRAVFRDAIYKPLLAALGRPSALQNSPRSRVNRAIAEGRIQVDLNSGIVHGDFNAKLSKDLKAMGAKWRAYDETFVLAIEAIPPEMRDAVARSAASFQAAMQRCDAILADVVPAKIADAINVADIFDSTLFRVDRQLVKSLPKSITVPPNLSDDQRKRIAKEWQLNLDKWIRDFTAEEIIKLRAEIQKSVLSGNRWEASVKKIMSSYGVTKRKAEFLAQQESALLIAKFKETRYTDAGSKEYKWSCVHMPHDTTPTQHTPGNVRFSHGKLDGTIQRWDNPPITTAPGQPQRRNHPGEDYRCRCVAIPRITF